VIQNTVTLCLGWCKEVDVMTKADSGSATITIDATDETPGKCVGTFSNSAIGGSGRIALLNPVLKSPALRQDACYFLDREPRSKS
jgi:hypothetical protein